ncbi:MAG: cob(I)yrinic acid a,c-diamide adenosyltransferase, partial [bacterium]|nr:cob(I)yrinic acid a,c-diamide adenosyltransferase [bacterium]
ALGHGLRIYVMQFMKGQTVYGELESAKRFSDQLTIEQVGRPQFIKQGKQTLVDRQMAQEAFARARALVSSGKFDLVVLDELNCAVDFDLVELEAVKEMIRSKPEHTELVITGRNVHLEIVELADLVTEMREIKHYYNAGQPARVGIES